MRLTCNRCNNSCLSPPSTEWVYACPRCGSVLPSAGAGTSRPSLVTRLLGARKQGQRLVMAVVLAVAWSAAVRGGWLSYHAAASVADPETPKPADLRLTAAERDRYLYRVHQLQQDLRRDPTDFEVLIRLGQLHLQLAQAESERRPSHLRLARHYLLGAIEQARMRPEQNWARGLIEAANSPNPMVDVANIPGDYGPPRRDDEAQIRLRLGFLEDLAGAYPHESRLLRRIGTSYTQLYSVMSSDSGPRMIYPDAGGVTIADPREARLLAERSLARSLACARTHEGRCRALYARAQLCRITHDPARAAVLLDQFLRIQPNNWLVSMEASTLCRQLDQPDKAARYQALSTRWRLPGWI
jgi:hypothetical protein